MLQKHYHDMHGACSLHGGYMITINMQHIYESLGNRAFQDILTNDSMAHFCVDGKGAALLLKRITGRDYAITVGNEMTDRLLRQSAGRDVLVIGSSSDHIDAIRRMYPDVRITHDDSMFKIADLDQAEPYAQRIKNDSTTRYSTIFIALGVPKQELLASRLSRLMPDVPMYCIGGSFEMISGSLKRAPKLVQTMGLEAIWRFVQEPNGKRLQRLVYTYSYFAYLFLFPGKILALESNRKVLP